MRRYRLVLRALAILIVWSVSYLVVCTDINEEREPWEFVPIEQR